MPEDNVLVKLEHGKKSFGDVAVLKDISLEVRKGEVVAIIGPSGGGKSTLLRCMTLLETLDAGSLSYGDLPVAEDNGAGHAVYGGKDVMKRAKSRFGLVFQNFNLFPHYSVIKNVTDAPVSVQKRPRAEALERGREDPEVLFFDEPTSALDPELTRDVLKVIRDLAAERMTMVIVTHEMTFARDVADRIIFMDDGLVVEEGRAVDVINNPQQERTRAFLSQYQQG